MQRKCGRKLLFKTAEELENRIEEYYKYCEEKEKPLTMGGLALFLGVARQTIINYNNKEEYGHIIDKARSRVEAEMEEKMLTGKLTTTGCIFSFKNNFGWSDRTEIVDEKLERAKNEEEHVDLSGVSLEELKELLKNGN